MAIIEIKKKKIEDDYRAHQRKLAVEHDNEHAVCFTVTLPYTKSEFDKVHLQDKYKMAVSIAARVPVLDVAFVHMIEQRSGADSIHVFTKVRAV